MRIVIVGGGSSGWMAASMFARLMGNQLDICLVESEQIGTVGVGEATIPPILQFNKVLGINEDDFIKATKGTFKLGIEFENWLEPNHTYMHAFGRIGKDMGFAGFHHNWLKSKTMGFESDLWDYSINYQAAKANKFEPLRNIPHTDLPGIAYAYHFDAGLYANYLRTLSEGWGVRRVEGVIRDVRINKSDGTINSLVIDSGQIIHGDFFVDCSGFRSLLLGEALKTGFQDWRHWLPCDRAVALPCESDSNITPYTRAIAHEAGWQWRIPLQHRTGNGLVYCSDYYSDEKAAEILLSNIDGMPLSDPRTIKFVTGRREKQWYKNCLALGLSSGFLEPLESTSLHLVQSGIVRFMKLFPRNELNSSDIDEFNKQSAIEFERIRDFIIMHYYLNNREEHFWKRCQNMEIPATLKEKLTLFSDSGRIFREQDELFTEVAWQQVMIGQGLYPKQYHPLADSLSEQQTIELMKNLKLLIKSTSEKLRPHKSYLDQVLK